MTVFKLGLAGHEYSFDVTRQGASFLVRYDGRELPCRLISNDGSGFVLEIVAADGARRQIQAAGAADGDARQLWVEGQTVAYQRLRQQSREATPAGSLSATIPAVVTEILVAPGDAVAAGEKLILLESMKMIMPIQAPIAGTVKSINCRPGESVQAGVELITLEPEDKE
jgi:biotin carboxyl carrier protein